MPWHNLRQRECLELGRTTPFRSYAKGGNSIVLFFRRKRKELKESITHPRPSLKGGMQPLLLVALSLRYARTIKDPASIFICANAQYLIPENTRGTARGWGRGATKERGWVGSELLRMGKKRQRLFEMQRYLLVAEGVEEVCELGFGVGLGGGEVVFGEAVG